MSQCSAPTICGPRTFWAFNSMGCSNQEETCGNDISCNQQDISPISMGGMTTQGWLRSLIWMLLGTDKALDCYDPTRRRRGNPADGFTGRKSGNSFWSGYRGTTQEQLNAYADDLKSQIGGFLKSQGIATDFTVKASFSGAGQARLDFSIGQESLSVSAKRNNDAYSFIWNNI